ncbi:TonB-dependent receptor [Muricauda oceani]|uniref:TonB-dependent receptor n=1 Tax=Flagellimonas oceani TaxID=2698672 RepID=A0A6G7J1N6_9FLAO|nr:TonB-dependent receptor [Allomuricauda oceani]MBW8241607.1 TonB-dependent receptor [Allomuricauda oceani]QII44407.1 TonB-dependent receptor [Allomuricauda oceani]
MQRILIPLLLIVLTTFQGLAQQNQNSITISGKVVDSESGQPLEYATFVLQSAESPDQVTGGITDIDGNFEIETAPGTYNIRVEFISYKTYSKQGQTYNLDTNLGSITLSPDVAQLAEVEVVGEKTTVEVRLDKKIYNIGKDLTTSGATISDALSNVPSVNVDIDGAISLRGNENVRILINGKPSALAGFGSTEALQQLPADAIEKVEVITSPSARYDAEGTAGILNIVLKREKTLGFNGSVNLYGGHPTNGGITANANLRTDKFNFFTTVGYRYREGPGNGFFDTRYFDPRQDAFLDSIAYDRNIEDRDIDRINRGVNLNFGMEYFFSEQSSITGSYFYRTGSDEDLTTNVNDYFLNNDPQVGTTRSELETEKDNTHQISLNYINRLDEDGQVLTADVQFSVDEESQNGYIAEPVRYNNTDNTDIAIPMEETSSLQDQTEYLVQSDYVLPFGEGSQFEAGYRGTFENEVTDYRLLQENANGMLEVNVNQTNVFDFTQNVHALYSQYGSKFGDFNFLLGLRMESTQLKGKIESELTEEELQEEFSFPIDTDFDNNYTGLFPTVNLIYEFTERENVSLGYNRRINRPWSWFLNPFPSRSSRTNIFQGNPNLRPAFSNAFDLGYLKRWDKLTLTSSVYYQRETDAFQRVQEQVFITGPGGSQVEVIRNIPFNLATNDRTGAEVGMLYNPTKWLRLNGSVNFFRFSLDGEFNGVDYSQSNNSWFGRFSSKVELPWKIDWQTNAFYRGASDDIQGRSDGILSIDLAFSKDLLNDNATISLNVQDLLNSRKRSSFTTTDFFEQDSDFQWRQRQLRVSFIYRINEQKKRGRQERQDGGEFEEGQF